MNIGEFMRRLFGLEKKENIQRHELMNKFTGEMLQLSHKQDKQAQKNVQTLDRTRMILQAMRGVNA